MATPSAASDHWLSRILVRYLGVYLVYLAALVRAVNSFSRRPEAGLVMGLLVMYGLLLISEPWLSRRWGWYPWLYLLLQSALAMRLLLIPPHEDFLPMLFIPLSLQAVLFFKRRTGFIWIGAFTLAIAGPVLAGWGWALSGLVMVLLFGGLFFVMGNYTHLIHRAEAARQENQRLLEELQVAHHQLQDYAAQVEEYAMAQERGRLARELHDSATQTIFSMNLSVQAARMLLEREPGRAAEQLDRLQELAHSAVGEIHVLVNQLRPRSLAEEGLSAALRRLIAERETRDGLHIYLEVSGEKALPEPVAVGLYRIVQEALNNVARHAGTCEAVVRLKLVEERMSLEVEDHGVGFDPGAVSPESGHVGLSGMAERAHELGWKLSCDSQPGHGTRICVEEI
jgi:signal transduction histidine kinase